MAFVYGFKGTENDVTISKSLPSLWELSSGNDNTWQNLDVRIYQLALGPWRWKDSQACSFRRFSHSGAGKPTWSNTKGNKYPCGSVHKAQPVKDPNHYIQTWEGKGSSAISWSLEMSGEAWGWSRTLTGPVSGTRGSGSFQDQSCSPRSLISDGVLDLN